MFKQINQSQTLARLIVRMSEFLARRRGAPVVVGIALVIISFVLQIIEVYAPSQTLALMGVIFQNAGILTALIGLVLAEPLGK